MEKATITSKEAIEALLSAVPEYSPDERDVADELATVVYGSFKHFIADLLEDDDKYKAVLQRIFAFLEAFADVDKHARNILQTGLLEVLESNPPLKAKMIEYMGPKTLYLLREIDAFWEGRQREFHASHVNPWPERQN